MTTTETVIQRPSRTSYSAIKLYQRCPASWKYRYIDRLPETSGKAAERGKRVHGAGEKFIKGEIPLPQLPVQYLPFQPALEHAMKHGAEAEAVWICGPQWETLFPQGDGTDPTLAWIKAIVDLHYIIGDTLYIVDFKTGRDYPEHEEQLELYMVMGAARHPQVQNVVASAWYLDIGEERHIIRHGALWLTALRGVWAEKICAIEADEKFQATPSISNCRFCSFGKSKGGPCKLEFKDD